MLEPEGFMRTQLLLVAALALPAGHLAAQAPKPPATFESNVTRSWKDVHDRLLTMAKDTQFPDDKLSWRPHPDARSVLEEFRHVTIGLEMTAAQARGEKFDFEAREKADASKPKTRASMVAEMEAAIKASYPLVEQKPTPSLVGWLEHQGEHYGKLVTAYRANGIVPPVSRK
jgi:DinB superfamily